MSFCRTQNLQQHVGFPLKWPFDSADFLLMRQQAPATPRKPRLATAAVFASTAFFLIWLTADRFALSNDEGIFMEDALRILSGQIPYRDSSY